MRLGRRGCHAADPPDIELIKTAGDAADGDVFATVPGPVEYTYEVTNDGSLPLVDVTVTDDAGTPDDTSDDFGGRTARRPRWPSPRR